MESITTPSKDPLAIFDELLLEGRAPDVEAFAALYPEDPSLGERIHALTKLRKDLSTLARGHSEMVPSAGKAGWPDRVGDFHLLKVIGQGGMGVVCLGLQDYPKRLCAVKLIDRRASSLLVERFAREASIGTHLHHPAIAQVYGHGVDGNFAYLASELINGFTLRQLFTASGRAGTHASDWLLDALTRLSDTGGITLPWGGQNGPMQTLLTVARQLASGLAHAHEQEVVHRDIKPSNVMLTFRGDAKIIDFGIALQMEHGTERLTRTGVFIGTHEYAAPEQLRGESAMIGPWTDTYSLGVTLFEMLTHQLPFQCSNLGERIVRSHHKPECGPRAYNPNVPPALDRLVLKALHPDPTHRYLHGAAMLADIEKIEAFAGRNVIQVVTLRAQTNLVHSWINHKSAWLLAIGVAVGSGVGFLTAMLLFG